MNNIKGIKDTATLAGDVYIVCQESGSLYLKKTTLADLQTYIEQSDFTSLKLDTSASVSVAQGEMAWNADEETFDFGLNGAILQGGQELHYHVRNGSGADIADGTPIMYNSADGTLGNSGRIKVVEMDGSDPVYALYFMGLATEGIDDGDDGKITDFGQIRGIDTTGATFSFGGGETWSDGEILWVDPVNAGYLTNVKPASPLTALPIAIVVKAHSSGTLFVRATTHDEQTAWGDRAGGNYSEFESDGTLKFSGDATVWDDALFELTSQESKTHTSGGAVGGLVGTSTGTFANTSRRDGSYWALTENQADADDYFIDITDPMVFSDIVQVPVMFWSGYQAGFSAHAQ